MLECKPLGKTGLEVTQLGYGSMGLRGPRTWGVRVVEDEDAERMLHSVLDAGINFIDTSPDYGLSEERIGKFIGSRRSEFLLATKCGCAYVQHEDHLEVLHEWNADVVRRNLDASLNRLCTDHVDVLQFHGGDAETLQQTGLIDLLIDWRSQGVIRSMGVSSNFLNLNGLIDLQVFDTIQMPYSCLAPENERWIAQAAEVGAGVIVRGGIAQGGPEAEIQRPALNDVWNAAALEEVLPEGLSKAELILRYTLSHPNCDTVIVGTANADHLAANVEAAKRGPLPEELRKEIGCRVAAVLAGKSGKSV